MRYAAIFAAVVLCVVVQAVGAGPAWAEDPMAQPNPAPYRIYTWTGLQPDDTSSPPPPPPPAPMVDESMPAPADDLMAPPAGMPSEMAPPPPSMEPMPAPCAPPPAYYERQDMGSRIQTVPVVHQGGCCLNRDCQGWSVTPQGCRYGCWEVWAEGSYALLSAPDGYFGLPPYIAGPVAAPDPIKWDGLDYEGAWGGRLTLRRYVGPQEFVELRGNYYGKWDDNVRDSGQFGFAPGPAGVGGVIAPNTATLDAEAEVYGAELNYWSEIACMGYTSWSLGAGVRWLQFNEEVSATNWAQPFAPFNTPPYVDSDVDNQFIGLQLGSLTRYEFTPCFDVTLTLKGMIGNLSRDIDVNDRSFFSGGPHSASSEDDEIVFGADIDLNFRYRLSRRIAITAGYNFLFLDGVQRAHEAMDFSFSNSGAVQAQQKTDQLVVHSFLVGLHFNF